MTFSEVENGIKDKERVLEYRIEVLKSAKNIDFSVKKLYYSVMGYGFAS